MSDETIVRRLRAYGSRLPAPDAETTDRTRRGVLAAAEAPRRRTSRRVAALALALAAAFGGGYAAASAGGDPGATTLREGWPRIGTGVSLDVPPGWDGRVLFLDPSGAFGAIFQLANFELPANDGFSAPTALPPGEEDPIKAMRAGDVLVTVSPDAASDSRSAPARVSLDDLETVSGGRVPRGHTVARGVFCWGWRCLAIEADFGGSPTAELAIEVDRVLASLQVDASRP
jgi:hypothetical protein